MKNRYCDLSSDVFRASRPDLRRLALGTSLAAIALSVGMPAAAQDAASARDSEDGPATASPVATPAEGNSPIIVTGTRIVSDGFSQPTPTTVVSADDFQASPTSNIADFVNELPALSGTVTPSVANASTSAGSAGQNFLDLRGLDASRTLVLLDGRRVVPTATSGSTDINNIPSELVSRVDVVTGGASAAYGSDAVAGVVNFVLDTDYTGIKGNVEGGISSRGDGETLKSSLSFGAQIGERLHVLLSGMASYSAEIDFFDREKRKWNTGTRKLANPAYISQVETPDIPALLTYDNVNNSLSAAGGLITSGPARGIQFGEGGVPSQFDFGTPIIGSFMVGGQYGDTADQASFIAGVRMYTAFGRADYDITDSITAFAQFNYGNSLGTGSGAPERRFGNVSIKSDNAFLPDDIRELACGDAAPNTECFRFGTDNADLARSYDSKRKMALGGGRNWIRRETYIGTVGLDGDFSSNWRWNLYYQFGRSDVNQQLRNNQILANYDQAVDAVFAPDGSIVCRSTLTDPDNGCEPLNLFGVGVASQAAKDYVLGTSKQITRLTQQVAEATVQGDLLDLWAGPLAVAFGAGYRKEEVETPYTDPLSAQGGRVFFAANYQPTEGSYDVKELFGEIALPLARDIPFVQALDLNAALRMTDYSTSGTVFTYKLGGTYRPIDDILIRATWSRDIRAPNLNELFSGGTTGFAPATDPLHGNTAISVPQATVGNPNLTPEIAKSLGIGAVYQPGWLPGFSASVDYFHIDLNDAISVIGLQQELDLCASGARPDFCELITRGPGVTGGVEVPDAVLSAIVAPVNIASVTTSGFDIELAYRQHLSDIVEGWDGTLNLRAVGTNVIEFISDNGLGTVHDSAGETGQPRSGLPDWRWKTSLGYSNGPLDLTLYWRHISPGVYSTSFFDNSAGPLTSDNNHVDGADYIDLSIQYSLFGDDDSVKLTAAVRNLFDQDPPTVAHTASYLYTPYNPSLFDGIGRYFNLGISFDF